MFSSVWGDHKKKYPQQEDILEWVKPALPLEEEFDNLFLKDLVWAHVVSLHQWLNMPQFQFAAPLVALLQKGLQDKEQIEWLGPEVEFMVRYAAMVGGRNLELVRACLSMSGPTSTSQSAENDKGLQGTGWGDGGPVYLET